MQRVWDGWWWLVKTNKIYDMESPLLNMWQMSKEQFRWTCSIMYRVEVFVGSAKDFHFFCFFVYAHAEENITILYMVGLLFILVLVYLPTLITWRWSRSLCNISLDSKDPWLFEGRGESFERGLLHFLDFMIIRSICIILVYLFILQHKLELNYSYRYCNKYITLRGEKSWEINIKSS